MSSEFDDHSARRGTEEIIDGVGEVVNATLELVGDLAKRSAEATTPVAHVVPPADSDAPPLNVVVHYGVATVTNMIELLGNAVRDVATMGRTGTGQPRPSASTAPSGGRPSVKAGGTLRIPLSIENPAGEPIDELGVMVLDMHHRGGAQGKPLAPEAVRSEPEALTIAPKDFEKLTLFIDTAEDTAPGRYEAVIGLGGSSHEVTVRFDVV
jgi:hypothetical protein